MANAQLRLPLPRYGDAIPYGAPMLPPFKFRMEGTCWIWLGATITNNQGKRYGVCTVGGRQVYVHRFMYERYHGPIPRGHDVHHVCFATLCGQPAHLQAALATVNRLKMTRGRKRKGRGQ